MKTINALICWFILTYSGIITNAQNTSDSVKVTYKNKTVVVKPQGDESYTTIKFKDTSINKKIVVKIAVLDNFEIAEKKIEDQLDTNSKKVYNLLKSHNSFERKHFIETEFFSTLDLGLSSATSDISPTITPKLGKSINLSLGLINQNMNLYKGQVLLSYGVALNNFYLKYEQKQMIQTIDKQGFAQNYIDSTNKYSTNRLDIKYITLPILFEYHSKSDNFNLAAGVEIGFNGKGKYVLKGDNNGINFKNKTDANIKLNPTQVNAVVRIGIDNIAIYGKYTITDLQQSSAFQNVRNPHTHLYSVGICFFGI